MREHLTSIAIKGSKLGLGILLLLNLAGYLGKSSQYFELASHFKVQYLSLAVVFLLILTWHRIKLWALIGTIPVLLNAYEVIPLYIPGLGQTTEDEKIVLRVMLSNVQRSNTAHSKLVSLVHRERPDILVAEEVDTWWAASLEALTPLLPYKKIISRNDNFGIAIYSRFPCDSVETIDLGKVSVPSIFARITIAEKAINLLAVHPPPPIGTESYSKRNSQLSAISTYIKHIPNPKIVIGDLNVTMWSPYFTELLEESNLINARKGYGVLASWPTQFPPLMIPLDHFLTSPDVQVKEIRPLGNIGSDHLPIMVHLVI